MDARNLRESLFEKLSNQYADGTSVAVVPPEKRQLKSICDHLIRLLNTRQGTLSHLPDYGMPDIAEVYRGLPASLDELKNTIVHVVEKYEPRLEKIRIADVSFDPLKSRIAFKINAMIKNRGHIVITTTIASTGQAYVVS
jgi:type VI secretion system protein